MLAFLQCLADSFLQKCFNSLYIKLDCVFLVTIVKQFLMIFYDQSADSRDQTTSRCEIPFRLRTSNIFLSIWQSFKVMGLLSLKQFSPPVMDI